MKANHRASAHSWYLVVLFFCVATAAWADVPLASRDADRQAKVAAPANSEAFVYVYRGDDASGSPIAVTLTGRETARLAPRTFGFWKVAPGRVELAVERSASTLPLQTEGGHVYYVELTRGGGVPMLRAVSFATGRTQVYRSQLVAQTREPAPTRTVSAPPREQGATHGAIMLKPGTFALAQSDQTILAVPRTFKKSASSVLGLEGEYFLRPNISLGLEGLRYSSKFAGAGGSAPGNMDTTAVLFNVKSYFLPDSAWQPYLGVGLGGVSNSFSGSVNGNTGGVALQAAVGIQWRPSQFALRTEYKYVRAKTKDDNGQEVDASGSGFFLGLGFYF